MCWLIPDPCAHLHSTSQNVLPFQNNFDATGDKFSLHKNNVSWLLLQDTYQYYTILPHVLCYCQGCCRPCTVTWDHTSRTLVTYHDAPVSKILQFIKGAGLMIGKLNGDYAICHEWSWHSSDLALTIFNSALIYTTSSEIWREVKNMQTYVTW